MSWIQFPAPHIDTSVFKKKKTEIRLYMILTHKDNVLILNFTTGNNFEFIYFQFYPVSELLGYARYGGTWGDNGRQISGTHTKF